jgi:hypothetical protein
VKNIYIKRKSEQFKAVFRLPYLISHALWYFVNAAIFLTAAKLSPPRTPAESYTPLGSSSS